MKFSYLIVNCLVGGSNNLRNSKFSMSMISALSIRQVAVLTTFRVVIGINADEDEAIVGLCRLHYTNL